MPGAKPRKSPWLILADQLRRQGTGQGTPPGSGRL
jgi:hypothetical protein